MKIIICRLWEARDRLLALSEQSPATATTRTTTTGCLSSSATPSTSNNKLSDKKVKTYSSSSCQFDASATSSTTSTTSISRINMPRLGLRFHDKRDGRSSGGHSSEPRLPDKLTQALKALRPGVLSHVTHPSSPFKNQGSNYVVAADDVIYYSSSEQYRDRKSQQPPIPFVKRKSKSVIQRVSLPRGPLPFQSDVESVSTLEQIRQLYKSVPNLSTSCMESHERPNSVLYRPNGLRRKVPYYESPRNASHSSTPYLDSTGSPTDSGYRSAPRMPPGSPPPVICHRRSDYYSPHQAKYRQRYEHSVERIHEPTVVLVNGESLDPSPPPRINFHNSSSTTSSRPSTQNYDFEYFFRELPSASPKDTSSSSSTGSSTTVSARMKEFCLSEGEISEVLRRGRCKEYGHIVDRQATVKLKKCLENALYLLANEIRRLSSQLIKCRTIDIKTAVKVLFSSSVADSCIKAGIQATSIYALSGTGALKMSMQRRAGLCFDLGHFYKWMIESRISEAVSDEAAVFLCAVMECLLEEVILACVATKLDEGNLTTGALNEMLDRQNDVRKLLAKNERTFEGHAHFIKTNNCRCMKQLSRLSIKNDTELMTLLGMKQSNDQVEDTGERDLRTGESSLTKKGAKALFYYLNYSQHSICCTNDCSPPDGCDCPTISDWIRVSEAYAVHHSSTVIDDDDVRQAARILLNIDCPPRCLDFSNNSILLRTSVNNQQTLTQEMVFHLLRVNSEQAVDMALDFLGPAGLRNLNAFGLTALSEAILIGNDRTASALILAVPDLNIPVPNELSTKASYALLVDFAGWTPLTWAVAQKNYAIIVRLIDACAQVENNTMIKETPLQVATMLGDADIVTKLVNCDADPFRTTINYDSMKCNFRHMGSPSAVALAAAYNHRHILKMVLSAGTNYKRLEENLSLKDFLDQSEEAVSERSEACNSQGNTQSFLDAFNKEQQHALSEAMYYAAETRHIDIAMDLRKIGVAWNLHTWTTCLQAACAQNNRSYKLILLGDFSSRLADELTGDNIREIATLLFNIVRSECPFITKELRHASTIISLLYRRICGRQTSNSTKSAGLQNQDDCRKSMIDLGYVNNPDLSDITFLVENKVFYGHRIVLMNASDMFRKLLDNDSDQISLDNISYDTFNLVMLYLYSGGQLEVVGERSLSGQFELTEVAIRFGLNTLKCGLVKSIKLLISEATAADIFSFALRHSLEELKMECSTYLLCRMTSVVEDDRLRMLLQHHGQNGHPDYCMHLLKTFLKSFQDYNHEMNHH